MSEIVPYARRQDWYVIPPDWVPEVAQVPSVQLLAGSNVGVHRTHLPLLAERHESARAALLLPPPSMEARAQLDAQTQANGFQLRPYQHEAREFILGRRGTLLADMMRMGKTASAVAAHDPASGPLLVVAPLATREVWVRWMRARWPEVEPVVLRGRTYQPETISNAPCVFAHYDILQAWQNFDLRRIGTLVLDEAHTLSNRKTNRTKAAMMLAHYAERVIAATGTPLWNRPAGLWSILSILNPGAWGTWYEFANHYTQAIPNPWGTKYEGSANEEEFRARISEVMIRRTWDQVKADLPPIERAVEIADATEKELFKLDMLAEKARDYTKKRVHAGELARFRRLLGQLKVELAVDVASRVLDSDESVVVWAWHRDVARKIADGLASKAYPVECVTGAENADERDAAIARWRERPVSALVVTISVGQVGIDLSHARHAVFAEVDFTPTTVAQAEMRTFSPDRPMSVTYLIVDHEVDRTLVNALQEKCLIAHAIGVPAADTAIDVIARAFDLHPEDGDLSRLLSAFLAGYDETA